MSMLGLYASPASIISYTRTAMSKANGSHGSSIKKHCNAFYDASTCSVKDATQVFSKEVVPYPLSVDRETQQL
jgi:hypothetical protein